MFARILAKSISRRKGKIVTAIVAVMMGAAIASALLTVSLDVTGKVDREFRKFGANLLVLPRSDTIDVGIGSLDFGSITEQRYINESDLWKIKTIEHRDNILGYVPYLYQVADVEAGGEKQRVVVSGTWFDREEPLPEGDTFTTGVKQINGWWEVKGDWVYPDDAGGAGMIGVSVAEKMGLDIGDAFTVSYSERQGDTDNTTSESFTVKGIVDSGGFEDNQIFIDLAVAQLMTDRDDKVHAVQVSALCIDCPVNTFIAEIEGMIPYVEAKSVKQLTSAEMNVLGKIESMMLMVTGVALIASALGVMTTMTAGVVERRNEIGLMKSIGAENREVAGLFLAEAAIVGVVGGIAGYLVGLILADFIGMSVFGSGVDPQLSVIPTVLGLSVGVTLLAAALPIKRAVGIEPIVLLRGD